jgi:hypothetical protein
VRAGPIEPVLVGALSLEDGGLDRERERDK